jgi:hypothetical protein
VALVTLSKVDGGGVNGGGVGGKRREHVLQKLCSVSRVFSVENTCVLIVFSINMVFTTPLTKRGDLERPTKSALLFVVRGKKKTSFFCQVKKQFLPLH